MFRVVQECLTNVHRHAESTKATIRIARDEKRVYLEVQMKVKECHRKNSVRSNRMVQAWKSAECVSASVS
jgi:signal transduction histidine kinase